MKAYKELSVEIGESKLLQSPPEGTKPSHAGKVTTRSGRRARAPKSWVDTVAGRDYLSQYINYALGKLHK